MNRVGAGLDYTLNGGGHPLVLMADAVLDVYNFRAPTFNTSRITSFDVGARYGFNRNLYGSLGWMTYNDSENDASGSGTFAGLQWISDGSNCEICEPANVACAGEGATPPPPPPAAPAGPTTTIDPNPAPAAAPPQPAVQPAPAEAPSVVAPAPAPAPASEPPSAAPTQPTPAPAEQNLVLPDGRADVPVRNRLVSSLQQEFANPPPELSGEPLDQDYDPRSWAEPTGAQPTSGADTAAPTEDNGVELPELQLFPESVQASAKDARPQPKGKGTGKATSAAKEKALPTDDQSVVDVEIVSDPPGES